MTPSARAAIDPVKRDQLRALRSYTMRRQYPTESWKTLGNLWSDAVRLHEAERELRRKCGDVPASASGSPEDTVPCLHIAHQRPDLNFRCAYVGQGGCVDGRIPRNKV